MKRISTTKPEEEIIKEDRKELSEDQINVLSDTINSLKVGMMIEVLYYVNCESCYKKMIGIFTKLDETYKRITVIKTKIDIIDIYDIKVLENAPL